MAAPLLTARSVTVHLGQRLVLDGVDLTVTDGDFLGLIGPNGAGKTTLLRAILGLVPPTSGEVLVGGLPIGRTRELVGYVPQRHEFAWDFPISVWDTVMTGRIRQIGWLRRPGTRDRAAVQLALHRVGLADLHRRPVGELSGGQRQRVLVARALAAQPRLLLLDEPFSGVDTPTRELLTPLFEQLAAEGHALVMTTHDLTAVTAVCTRMCVLNTTVVAVGHPSDLGDPGILLRTLGVTFSGDVPAVPREER